MKILLSISIAFSFFTSCDTKKQPQWGEYLGGGDRSHYSELTQINPSNVATLQKAWEFRTGEEGQVQCNPIIVNGKLYGVTAFNNLFALNRSEEHTSELQSREK